MLEGIHKVLVGDTKICLLDNPYPTIWLLGKQSYKNMSYVICILKNML